MLPGTFEWHSHNRKCQIAPEDKITNNDQIGVEVSECTRTIVFYSIAWKFCVNLWRNVRTDRKQNSFDFYAFYWTILNHLIDFGITAIHYNLHWSRLCENIHRCWSQTRKVLQSDWCRCLCYPLWCLPRLFWASTSLLIGRLLSPESEREFADFSFLTVDNKCFIAKRT